MEKQFFKNIKPLDLKDKRGMSVGDIYPVMLTIGLVAILIAIVLFVLDEFNETTADEGMSRINESYVPATIGRTLAGAADCGFNDAAIVLIMNESVETIPAANYALDPDTGLLRNLTDTYSSNLTTENWDVTYTYTHSLSTACNATEDIIEDIADFVPWIGIILLVIAASIVIGILVRNLAGGSSRV